MLTSNSSSPGHLRNRPHLPPLHLDRQTFRLLPLHPPRPRIQQNPPRRLSQRPDLNLQHNIPPQRSYPSQHRNTMALPPRPILHTHPRALDRNRHNEHPDRSHRHRNVHLSRLGPEHGFQIQVARHHSIHTATFRHACDGHPPGYPKPRRCHGSFLFVQSARSHDPARNVLQPHHDDPPVPAPVFDGVE
jgi:hypothetical protein